MNRFSRRTLLQGATAASAGTQAVARPNVLMIMTDQQRFDCLGANGNPLIRTPNLDRLAAQSANFANAFVQAPVCVPSRISYFTGRYPHSHRNRVNYTPCDPRETFLQRHLKDAGYRTGSVGKLHLHPPTNEHARSTGFDRVLLDDGVPRTDPYSDYVKWRAGNDPRSGVHYNAIVPNPRPGENPYRGVVDYEYSPTAWVGLKTREMLSEFAGGSQPFFLFSSFFKPHSPFTIPAPYDAMYNGVEIPLPKPVALEEIQRLPLPVQKLILRGKPVYDMDRTELQWAWRSYYAAVTMIDREVGLILDELEKTGKAGNTVVIFCTDHGDQMLEHGLMGKNVFFESSVHVPFLLRYPGAVRPGVYRELVEMVDVLPSVLDFCRVPIPVNVQGRSFAPLIGAGRGEYPTREYVFAENIIPEVITTGSLNMSYQPGEGIAGILHPDAKMVRSARWKLNYYLGHGGEVYDLADDPAETRNLFGEMSRRGVVDELRSALLDWMITADETDQIAPRWLV
jgi:arylsulfatase